MIKHDDTKWRMILEACGYSVLCVGTWIKSEKPSNRQNIESTSSRHVFPLWKSLLTNELQKPDSHPATYVVVDGYVFKDKTFQVLNSAKTLDVLSEESMSFSLSYICRQNDALQTMDKSVLYKLRYKYPVVDAVGVFKTRNLHGG